jgi:DNA polymerase elongation subunit (family B)
MTLYLDIETVGVDVDALDPDHRAQIVSDYGDPDAVGSDALDRLALSPWTASVVVACAWDDEKGAGICLTDGAVGEADLPEGFRLRECAGEADLLGTLWDVCRRRRRYATYNGRDFDLPFLVARSMVHSIPIHRPVVASKPWEDVHLDLCQALQLGYRGRATLDAVCRALGVASPKQEIDGSEVGRAWADGRRGLVARYCALDTRALAECVAVYDAVTAAHGEPSASRAG